MLLAPRARTTAPTCGSISSRSAASRPSSSSTDWRPRSLPRSSRTGSTCTLSRASTSSRARLRCSMAVRPPGGIYNQTSRRPSSDFGGEVSLKYGEDDYKQLGMTATGAATDWLDLRGTVMIRDRDAERDFVHARRIYAAPAATIHLGPDTRLTGLAYYQYDEVNGDTNGFLPVQGTLLPNPNGPIRRDVNLGEPDYNRYERNQWGAGFELTHDFAGSWNATINARWSDYSEAQDVIFNSFLNADNRTITRSIFPYAEDVKSFAIDGRVAGKFGTGVIEHNVLAGIDHRTADNKAFFGFLFGAGGTIDIYHPVYDVGQPFPRPAADIAFADQNLNQTGAYLQDQMAIGGFRLLLSGRYDWVDLVSFGTKIRSAQVYLARWGELRHRVRAGTVRLVCHVLRTDSRRRRCWRPVSSHIGRTVRRRYQIRWPGHLVPTSICSPPRRCSRSTRRT